MTTPAAIVATEYGEIVLAESQEKAPGFNGRRKKLKLNKFAIAAAVLASTNSILLGYDIGVMSGAVLFIKDHLKITSTQEEILIGSLNLFSLIGSLASGNTCDWIGRRYTIVLASITFLVGALLMGFAPSFLFLMTGRLVAGLGVGYSLMIAPVYIAEISPANIRGFLSSLPEVFINVGILLGYISNFAFSTLPESINWRLMLGLAAAPALAVALGVMTMPESPRWLVMQGRLQEAKQVLLQTLDNGDEEEADLRLQCIVKSISLSDENMRRKSVWKELLWKPSRTVLRILVAAIGINFFMQASGNDAVVYYCPEVFRDAGVRSKKSLLKVTILMGLAKTSCVLVSALFLDKFGRRLLLLLGSTGMTVSLAGLGFGSKLLEWGRNRKFGMVLTVVSICLDVSFFSIGLGPITWVYTSEIFPQKLRAQGSSIGVSVNRVISGMVSIVGSGRWSNLWSLCIIDLFSFVYFGHWITVIVTRSLFYIV